MYVTKWNGIDREFLSAATYNTAWWLQETEVGRTFGPGLHDALLPTIVRMYRMCPTEHEFMLRVGIEIQLGLVEYCKARYEVPAEYGVTMATDMNALAMHTLGEYYANIHATDSSRIHWNLVAAALFADRDKARLLPDKKVFVTNIKYDTDGAEVPGLPTEMAVAIGAVHWLHGDAEDYAIDQVTEHTGWCVLAARIIGASE